MHIQAHTQQCGWTPEPPTPLPVYEPTCRLCTLSVLSAEFYLGVGILGEEDDKGVVHPR